MAIAQEMDPNSIAIDNSEGLRTGKRIFYSTDQKTLTSPRLADRMRSELEAENNEEMEFGQQNKKKRRKSVLIRVWKYVKESWLGVMSGTGKI